MLKVSKNQNIIQKKTFNLLDEREQIEHEFENDAINENEKSSKTIKKFMKLSIALMQKVSKKAHALKTLFEYKEYFIVANVFVDYVNHAINNNRFFFVSLNASFSRSCRQ